MRPVRIAAAIAAATFLFAACSSQEAGWTYAPPSEAPVASGAPSGEPGSPAPSGEASAPASAPASAAASPAGSPSGEVVQISATGIKFDQSELDVPADSAFTLEFANNDQSVPHDVAIRDSSGAEKFKSDQFNGVETRSFEVPALPAGQYQAICTIHTNMTIAVTAE